MTEETIRNRTLIVPSTICNGPVMFFLPRTPGGVGRSRPPLGDARVIIGAPGVPRTGGEPARGSHAGDSARTLRTIAVAVRAYSPVTPTSGDTPPVLSSGRYRALHTTFLSVGVSRTGRWSGRQSAAQGGARRRSARRRP